MGEKVKRSSSSAGLPPKAISGSVFLEQWGSVLMSMALVIPKGKEDSIVWVTA